MDFGPEFDPQPDLAVLSDGVREKCRAMLMVAAEAGRVDQFVDYVEHQLGVSKDDFAAGVRGVAVDRQVFGVLTEFSAQGVPAEATGNAAGRDAFTAGGGAGPEHEPPPVENPPAGPDEDDDLDPSATFGAPVIEDGEEALENPHFTICGQDRGKIYIYQHRTKLVMSRGWSDWGSVAALTMFAPLHFWQLNFPSKRGIDKDMAVDWLQRQAERKPQFDPESVRGRGAWVDDGRFVFHFGHRLWVDGDVIDVTAIKSAFIYEQGKRMRLPADEPLSGADGIRLAEVFKIFAWTRPASAALLAGWCALAPIGGALDWRPHLWITGGAGAGKTTILKFMNWLMMGTAVFAQGNSTEAGLRQQLQTDSRAVLFDESEQNNERDTQRIQSILSLMRQSSTESQAQTYKGTQGGESMRFMIRSMFCLGSIQVGLKQQADMERIAVLALKPKKDGADPIAAAKRWEQDSAMMDAVKADPELPGKLIRRSLMLLPTTIENIKVFKRAAAEKFGSQRDGDQYGTLLAGAWSLSKSGIATPDQARAMIDRYDWSEYLEGSETAESEKVLNVVLTLALRAGGYHGEVSVGELIQRAAHMDCDTTGVSPQEAEALLVRHGLEIDWKASTRRWQESDLLIAHSHPAFKRLMEGTPFAADPGGHLKRLPFAVYDHKRTKRFGPVPGQRYVRIPMARVFADGESPVEDQG